MRALKDIDSVELFYRGTIIRKYNVGLNVKSDKDYYDYLLAYLPWETGSMIMVNISKDNSKKGAVFSGVLPICIGNESIVVNKKSFIHTLGKSLEDWYLLNDDLDSAPLFPSMSKQE